MSAPDSPSSPSLHQLPLWVLLEKQVGWSRGWESIHWQVAELSAQPMDHPEARAMILQLYKGDRAAYRFNLSSQAPKLFVICEAREEGQVPHLLTVCQDEAADYMDAGQPVLDIPLPEVIQAWMEAFMAHYGEWVDPREANRRLREADPQPRQQPGSCG